MTTNPAGLCTADVVRWTQDDGAVRLFRFLHEDARRGACSFYDLERGASCRAPLLLTFEMADVRSALATKAMQVVADDVRTPGMQKRAPDLARLLALKTLKDLPRSDQHWMMRCRIVTEMLSMACVPPDVREQHSRTDIFQDVAWIEELLSYEARASGIRQARLRNYLEAYFRYGCDDLALLPLTERRGAKGVSRSEHGGSKKTGRWSEEERKRGRRYQNRVDPDCIARLRLAIEHRVDMHKSVRAALVSLADYEEFYMEFRRDWCYDLATGKRLPGTRIPLASALRRHFRREVDRLRAQLPPKAQYTATPGSASDIASEELYIVDLDGTTFSDTYELVMAEGNDYVSLGPPTVLIGVGRWSDAIVRWYVTTRAESGDCYCNLIYAMHEDKAVRLLQLGIMEDLPGILDGKYDEFWVDGGAGRSYRMFQQVTGGLKLDLSFTRAWTPPDKGDVEGGIGLLKRFLDRDKVLMERLKAEVNRHMANLPRGTYTLANILERRATTSTVTSSRRLRLTPRAFEHVLVLAINAINLATRKDSHCLTHGMFVRGVEPTRAAIHNDMQAQRRGDGAVRLTGRQLGLSALAKKKCYIIGGRIRHNNMIYGGDRSEAGMAAAKAIQTFTTEWNQSQKEGKPWIYGTPTPWGHSLMWERSAGDWVEIPATQKTRKVIGDEADLVTIDFQNGEKNARRYRKQMQSGPKSSKKDITCKAQAESEKILAAYGNSPLVDKTSKRAARARTRHQEEVEQFTKHASAAGARMPTTRPAPPLPKGILDATLRPQTTDDSPYAATSLREQWRESDDGEGDDVRN